MRTPHKHAELIKAWADGAEIQVKDSGARWLDMSQPTWQEWNTYRIKPKTIKYRTFLWKPTAMSCPERIVVCVCTEQENQQENRAKWRGFIRWLTDWIEVEV